MALLEQLAEPALGTPAENRVTRHLRRFVALVALADALALVVAFRAAWRLRLTFDVFSARLDPSLDPSLARAQAAAPWILVAWLLVLVAHGAYSRKNLGAGSEEFRTIALASLLTGGLVTFTCYMAVYPISRGFLLLVFCLGTPLLLAERYAARQVLHRLRTSGRVMHRVVAVGGPSAVREIVDVLDRERYVGYQVVGACAPQGIVVAPDSLPVPLLGSVADARDVCERVDADTVLVTRGGYDSSADLRRIAWDLEGSSIDLVVVPTLLDVAGPRIHMRPVAGLPLLHVEQPQAGRAGGLAKRLFDLVVATLALLALSPLMLAVAALIKRHDGGPVFFLQARVGKAGAPFRMLKFRSMVVDAERKLDEVRHLNESGGVLFKIRDDPRITPLGRWLRKHSVDELPQLFNVLAGHMSLVGPRPPLPSEVASYGSDVRRRLLVRPGMTGLWQVSGRSELSWKESVRLDLYYVDNWSMTTDLVIMAKTAKAVLASSGAY